MAYFIGKQLRRARIEKKLSQKQVAEILVITPSTLSRYEINRYMPSRAQAIRFAKLLNLPPLYLITDFETGEPLKNENYYRNEGYNKKN